MMGSATGGGSVSVPQKCLFGDAPWEADDAAEDYVAAVVFSGPLDGQFDYRVPETLRQHVYPGRRLRVPLGRGNRLSEAYCVEVGLKPTGVRPLKAVAEVIDQQTLLSPVMLELTSWIAQRYLCSWGQVLEAVLPAGVRGHAGTRLVRYVSLASSLLEQAPNPPGTPQQIRQFLEQLNLPVKQAAIVRVLLQAGEALTTQEVTRLARCTVGPLQSLLSKGLLTSERRRTQMKTLDHEPTKAEVNLVLNPDQRTALEVIRAALSRRQHETVLLHGVTASGKTEVYIQAIQDVVALGGQALVLVPEISLTPQTLERFRARFGQVAVLHSHLTDSERHWHWQQIASGAVNVIVGARSAIFAPTQNLGLIVLDEEHETTFKQENAPRYHTREVAARRAQLEGIPLVLGSATPSLESWQRAQSGEYQLVSLPRRVEDRPLPDVATVDLRTEARVRGHRSALSRVLRQQMDRVLQDGGQVILLLNRRGYSTHLQCPQCGHVMQCPHCDIAMTYHRSEEVLLCHYCDQQQSVPEVCPECESESIRHAGQGTQRLEWEVRTVFPQYPCLRMDTDTMQAPGSHQKALAAFRRGEIKILLGTQMIAKGLDFPNVTLVGVINADLALHLPDFRAAERTFQLLAQVAGRAGRGDRGGRVLVQTFTPDHPAIQAACRHDFLTFAQGELASRGAYRYPPFTDLIRLIIRGPHEEPTEAFADHLASRLIQAVEQSAPEARVLGPAPAPLPRLRDKYRFNIQLQGPDGERLRRLVSEIRQSTKSPDEIEWIADVDPVSML